MGRRAGVTADETRERLVDAAADVFADRGYEGARVAEIAKRAGVTTGAIYAHYGNKADLLSEAIRSRESTSLDGLLQGSGTTVADMIRQLGRAVGKGRKGDGSLLVEAVGAARRDPDVGRLLHNNVSRRETEFALLVHEAQRNGELADDLAPEAVARLCTTLALGSMVARALQLDRPDHDDWAAVIERIVEAVAPSPDGPSDPSS